MVKKFWILAASFGGQVLHFLKFSNPKNFMFQLKKLEFWRAPFSGNPHFGTPNFVRFSLFFISTNTKKLIHLALTVQKFNISVASFEGHPPFWYSQILPNIIFSLWLVTLKISRV